MKKKLSVTIGIPAYNEGTNIDFLLNDISRQKKVSYFVSKLIIVSDVSTDNTVNEAKKSKIKLKLIVNKIRKGLANVQNTIIKYTYSDVLVLLQADIRINDAFFIEKLIKPIIEEKADLVVPSVCEMKPKTFFEKALYVSAKIKNIAYEKINNGRNVYTCRGIARAFSKNLYSEINFPISVGEDAFSYLYCIKNGFDYYFVNDAKVIFRLPTNFSDHRKQSLRFFQSQQILKEEFGKKLIKENYRLPISILLASLIENLIKNPFLTSFYIIVLFYLKFQSFFLNDINDKWVVSKSSKVVKNVQEESL